MIPTLPLLEKTDFPRIVRGKLQVLQVNLGYLCNQQCLHCHVNAHCRRASGNLPRGSGRAFRRQQSQVNR